MAAKSPMVRADLLCCACVYLTGLACRENSSFERHSQLEVDFFGENTLRTIRHINAPKGLYSPGDLVGDWSSFLPCFNIISVQNR